MAALSVQRWTRATISMGVPATQTATLCKLNSTLMAQLPRPGPERVQRALFIPDLLMERRLTVLVSSGIYFRGLYSLHSPLIHPNCLSQDLFRTASKREVVTGSPSETLICCSISLIHTAVLLWFSTVQSIKCIFLFAFGEKCPDSNPLKLSGGWGDVRDFFFLISFMKYCFLAKLSLI